MVHLCKKCHNNIENLKVSKKMKKILTILFLFAIIGNLLAEISVKSFRKLENDMTARIDAPKNDQNGDVCAIIKVVTTQTGFIWEPDGLGIISAEPKGAEYWIYVPYGAKHITIKHPQLGLLRDYQYPLPIEKATVYEMVLMTGKITTIIEEIIESQWLEINPDPADAAVYIDNVFVKTGAYQVKIKPGSYTYRVEASQYHTEAGKVEVTDNKKELTIKLNPAFGYVTVNTEPEKDAKVIIDGKTQSNNTPCKSEALASGEHTVQVLKDMYQPATQKVTVTDGQTTPVNIIMQPNFAEVTITAPSDADIYINSKEKGTGTWNGRLNPGVYSLEASKDKHRSAKQDIEVIAGDKKTIDLQPTPIYGSLDVITTPVGASISIDGKEYGTTPNTINKLLIGDYTIRLNKTGFASVNKTVTITDGKSTEINETLLNGRSVTINSSPSSGTLYIDNIFSGSTPYKGILTFGNHTLRIEKDGRNTEKTISIAQNDGETNFDLILLQSFLEIKGVNFDMVEVKGGLFEMGSDSGEKDEKPLHKVEICDFLIGKTEITQAQWKIIMGNNPSFFKGDNLPVEQVNWEDVQLFIKKLNQLTGKDFRLPSEAEWEYAAGSGTEDGNKYSGTDEDMEVDNYAWNLNNSNNKTHNVATKLPNALGLYDMSGNVWEWCSDWYGDYSSLFQKNPTGYSSGSERVNRGGSWHGDKPDCRIAYRSYDSPGNSYSYLGFRLALSSK